jgi:hypothetical protein
MAKINKKNTQDVFAGLKYVDKLLNEAAGVGNPPKKLSFEEKMKLKLKEGAIDEAAEEVNEEELKEYGYEHPYNYNYDGNSEYVTEEPMEHEFSDEFSDEFGDESGIEGDEEFATHIGADARGAAEADLANEFGDHGAEDEFGSEEPHEHEIEREFDFSEDDELMEALLSEADPALDMPDDETVGTQGAMAPPVDASMGAAPDAGVAPLEATPTDEAPEMGADDEMGGDLGGGSHGSDLGGSAAPMGAQPAGMAGEADAMATSPVNEPEDIDQLIADLVKGTGAEETEPSIMGENELKTLGFTDLEDEEPTDKVKMEAKAKMDPKAKKAEEKKKADEKEAKEKKDGKKEVKEGEIKLTKLGDEDITGKVKGATTGGDKAVHKGEGKRNDPSGFEYTDLGDETIDSAKVKDAKAVNVSQSPKFDALKKENEQKTTALYTLAEKVITLEDEIANLKFAKFKLEKVNNILTLLPELKLETREKLVYKFGECKTYVEAKKLYVEVAEMVKDHKRGSLNEAVLKGKKSTKYFSENVEGFESPESDSDDRETARRNMLMGLKGYDESYGQY